MAVFLVNVCKFPDCGVTFSTLRDLIQHIEETHIDYDPRVLEKQELQQPTSLPISYIFRFFCDAANKKDGEGPKRPAPKPLPRPQSAASMRSATPTGSEMDEEDVRMSDDEDSDDSWTTGEEFSQEYILRLSSVHSMANNKDGDAEKPFACPVGGCNKRYKNINGIKYHARHGHRRDTRVRKPHKCRCGKSYKTLPALRNHAVSAHGTVTGNILIKTPTPVTTISGSLTPMGITLPVSFSGATTIPIMTTVNQVASVMADGKIKHLVPKPGTVAAAVAFQAASSSSTVSQLLSQIPVTQVIEQIPAIQTQHEVSHEATVSS